MAKREKAEKNVNAPEAGGVAQTTETAMAKSSGSSLMNSAPDWLAEEMKTAPAKMGFENIDGADIILPRLAVANNTSPEFLDRELDVDMGDIFDNLSKQVLVKQGETITVIPIVVAKSRIRFEKPQPPAPIMCRSLDGKKAIMKGGMRENEEATTVCDECVYKQFADDKRPECTEFLSFLLMLPEYNFVVYAASFKSTGLKLGRRWISQALQTGAPLFAGKYLLKTKEYSNGSQKWFNFDYEPAGWVSKEEYTKAKSQFETLSGKTWAPSDLGGEGATEAATEGSTDFPPAKEETVEAPQPTKAPAAAKAQTSDGGF